MTHFANCDWGAQCLYWIDSKQGCGEENNGICINVSNLPGIGDECLRFEHERESGETTICDCCESVEWEDLTRSGLNSEDHCEGCFDAIYG